MAKKPTVADAQLILQLYDLRREAEMRKARNWWVVEFFPESADDLQRVSGAMGSQENAWFRQVLGYWGMATSFVLQGVLNEDLFLQPAFSGEMFLIFAKVQPLLKEWRQKLGDAQIMRNVELVRYTHEIRTRARAVPRQACGNDEAEKSRAQGELESIPPHQHPHSVILIGCADDLVVPDPGCEYAGRSVRGNRP